MQKPVNYYFIAVISFKLVNFSYYVINILDYLINNTIILFYSCLEIIIYFTLKIFCFAQIPV